MGQSPCFRILPNEIPEIPADLEMRESLTHSLPSDTQFNCFLNDILRDNIPISYIEGYKYYEEVAESKYPSNPKTITTGYGFHSDDFFKTWAAKKVTRGTSFYIFQHGGSFGIRKFDQIEDHQIEVANRYFSWGWKKAGAPHVSPMPSAKLSYSKTKLRPKETGHVLIALQPTFRYASRLTAEPLGPQVHQYLLDQIKFMQRLSCQISSNVRYRPYYQDMGWGLADLFKDAGYVDQLSSGGNFYRELNQSRLFVATYGATTMFEALNANFPTLMFWDSSRREPSSRASSAFQKLAESGILHFDSESAALKLEEIYQDIPSWWNEKLRQDSVKQFCREFAWASKKWKSMWVEEIRRDQQ